MADIDLIPAAYRKGIRLRRWLVRFAVVYGAILLATGGAKYFLEWSLDVEAAEIARLEADEKSLLSQRETLDRLERERGLLEKRLDVLERLRRGPRVDRVFVAIDRSLRDDVWFLDWKFLRAGEFVPVRPETVNTGYFIIAPERSGDGQQRAWRLMTHMEIRARAAGHSALSEFVQRLSRQPEIRDVKIITTRATPAGSSRVVDFDLAVVVSGEPGAYR